MGIARGAEDTALSEPHRHIAHLQHHCHASKSCDFFRRNF